MLALSRMGLRDFEIEEVSQHRHNIEKVVKINH